jgi:phosphohistidine phosphatase
MYLYLIRHGIAIDRDDKIADGDRYLTAKGIAKTTTVARALAARWQFDYIFTSPLLRARQTAEILDSQHLCCQPIEIAIELAPGGSLDPWVQAWNDRARNLELKHDRLALVGHEPDLSQWAERLVFGRVEGKIQLKKAGIIELEFPTTTIDIGAATLNALLAPRYLI